MRHGDRHYAVLPLRDPERSLGSVDHRCASNDVEALLKRVHVPRDVAIRIELADHEPGVHSMIIFTHCHAATVAGRFTCPAGARSD
jgi:hypothetical protein